MLIRAPRFARDMAAADSPFGQATRMRVLNEYFASAGPVTVDNAWEHVYRCLLWMNLGAGLVHIYDSNHMQPGGVFYDRAKRFTELLCAEWGVERKELPPRLDVLFKGCVGELNRQQTPPDEAIDPETESELISAVEMILQSEGITEPRALSAARKIEGLSRTFFTIGQKRKNALGEGFEDLLMILLKRACLIPESKLKLRTPVSQMPGFRRASAGQKRQREPHPDIAVVEDDNITHVIATAKWSMRQDRETQFQSEYSSFQRNKVQSTELQYVLITNEFDIARLKNVARAIPTGDGGYIFHTIYHVSLPLLRKTHGARFAELEPWVGTDKLKSLSDFLAEMRDQYGGA